MKVKLVSHASVIVETCDTGILMDPWLFGKAFNESWALLFDAALEPSDLDKIDFVWISHEHPDHLHFASLKSLPLAFRERVTVLFQQIPSKNVINSLRNIVGFKKVVELPHRKRVRLTEDTSVYCYHSRQIDSALAVVSGGQTLLNLNDVETSARDRHLIKHDLGRADCVLNQFSLAGYGGSPAYATLIPEANSRIINNMIGDSTSLNARVTIPFASFVYFCCEDNKYINQYANTPAVVLEKFTAHDLPMKLLAPGEVWTIDDSIDNAGTLRFFDNIYKRMDDLEIYSSKVIPLEEISKAFLARTKQLGRNHSKFLLRLIKPLTIRIPDLNKVMRINVSAQEIAEIANSTDADLEINSQPLWFGFRYPWGIQTLGVSGRLRVHGGAQQWRRLRFLLAINNAGIHLRLNYVLSRDFMYFVRERGIGLIGQVIHRLRRARVGT